MGSVNGQVPDELYFPSRIYRVFLAFEEQDSKLKQTYVGEKKRYTGAIIKTWRHKKNEIFLNEEQEGTYTEFSENNSIMNRVMLTQEASYVMKKDLTDYALALKFYNTLKEKAVKGLKPEGRFYAMDEKISKPSSSFNFGSFGDKSKKKDAAKAGEDRSIRYMCTYDLKKLRNGKLSTYAKYLQLELKEVNGNYTIIATATMESSPLTQAEISELKAGYKKGLDGLNKYLDSKEYKEYLKKVKKN